MAAGAIHSYDPGKVILIVGGASMSGYADGTFIEFEEMSDGVTSQAGADGEVARTISNDPRCSITVTLQQTSLSNNVLNAAYLVAKATGDGVVPVLLENLLGYEIVGGRGWVKKRAKGSFGKESGTREWMIEVVATTPSAFIAGGASNS